MSAEPEKETPLSGSGDATGSSWGRAVGADRLIRADSGAGSVVRVTESVLPTRHGSFRIVGYRGRDGTELVALAIGITDGHHGPAPLVRVHSECLTGDALGSRRCDCGEQLDAALDLIGAEGEGVLVYVRGHEGRGIGLLEKLRAYRLQDAGADTVDANLALGHPADARDYRQAADVLLDLGIDRVRLISSNPTKAEALLGLGVEVAERVSAFVPARPENRAYLLTKQQRMRHDADRAASELAVIGHYRWLAARDRWAVAQSAQSLDGFLATRTGDGEALSGPEDHRHLHRLRSLADAVVVGAQTVVADDPRLTVRLVSGPNPVRVVLDPHGRVPATAQVLVDDSAPTLWFTGDEAAAPTRAHLTRVSLGPGRWEPERILAELADRGLARVLVEGGGVTVSAFVAAGALDRLYLTTVPVLLGDGVPGVRIPAVDLVADAPRWPSRRFGLGEDVCTELTLR